MYSYLKYIILMILKEIYTGNIILIIFPVKVHLKKNISKKVSPRSYIKIIDKNFIDNIFFDMIFHF